MQQWGRPCIFYEKSVAVSMRKGENGDKRAAKITEQGIANKPEKRISQTKYYYGCIYYEKDFLSSFGDCITSLAGT